MWKAGIILLISISFQQLQAQEFYSLSGKITDSIGVELYPATINLVATQDTLHTLTREDGSFIFKQVHARAFKICVSMRGYKSVCQSITVSSTKHAIKLDALILRPDYNDLDPVTITRVRPVTITGDTVSYNTAAFPVPDGSEVEDILKRLPGVEVDMNGNVIIQGKKISKVLVNGKEFFGDDVLLAIQNLPADVVGKLQVIDDYGDQARLTGVKSGDPAKVLNIVLQPDKRNGEFGRAEAVAGNQGKYAPDAFANAFKNDQQVSANAMVSNNSPAGNDPAYNARVNYADKWDNRWDGSINANTSGQSPHSTVTNISENFYSGEELQDSQTNVNSSCGSNENLNAGLTFKPNNYSTFRLTTSGRIYQSLNHSGSAFSTLQLDSGFTKTTIGQSENSATNVGQNFSSSLYFERLSPHSRKRFNIQISYGLNNNKQFINNQSAAAIMTDTIPGSSLLHYFVISNSINYIWAIKSTFFFPLSYSSFLELGYREQTNISGANILTRQPDSATGVLTTVDSLSQNTALNSTSQSLHLGYTGKVLKLELTAGLDAQPGQIRGTVDSKGDIISFAYFYVLPNLQAAWNFDKHHRLSLEFSGNPNLPGLQQLSPYTNFSNPQYPVYGNPNLKQSYTQNVALHFEQSSLRPNQFFGYGLNVGYSFTQHPIVQDLIHPKDSSLVIQETTWLNAGSSDNFNSGYYVTLPALFSRRLRITISGNLGYSLATNMSDSVLFRIQNWIWNQGLHFLLLIPDIMESDFSGNYTVSHSIFAASGALPTAIRTANISLNSLHHLFRHLLLTYQFTQSFTSSGNKLQPVPANLNASIQREILAHNKAVITLSGFNLLNQSAGVSQSASATGFTKSTSLLTGRYFMLSFLLKFSRFK